MIPVISTKLVSTFNVLPFLVKFLPSVINPAPENCVKTKSSVSISIAELPSTVNT